MLSQVARSLNLNGGPKVRVMISTLWLYQPSFSLHIPPGWYSEPPASTSIKKGLSIPGPLLTQAYSLPRTAENVVIIFEAQLVRWTQKSGSLPSEENYCKGFSYYKGFLGILIDLDCSPKHAGSDMNLEESCDCRPSFLDEMQFSAIRCRILEYIRFLL